MGHRGLPHRTLVAYARPEAFSSRTVGLLGKLGYRVLEPEEFERRHGRDDDAQPDLYLADERRLGEVPEIPGLPPAPIVVLTGRHGTAGADSRVAGAVKRPAGLHELYRLAQQILEETPRTAVRVPTHLAAHCRRRGRQWGASVLSLSENGCLLRSPEPMTLGTHVDLAFDLPGAGPVELEAETAYQLVPDMGLVFNATPPGVRDTIAGWVTDALART